MESKRGKRIKSLIVILIVLIFLLVIVIISFNKSISGNAILNPDNPPNYCSNDSIKSFWDSIFVENSSDIKIMFYELTYDPITQDKYPSCPPFFAYKIKNNLAYILSDSYYYNPTTPPKETTYGYIIYGDFTQEFLNKLVAINNVSNNTQMLTLELGFSNDGPIIPIKYLNPRTSSINLSQAISEYNQEFKISPENWQTNYSSDKVYYSFNENINTEENNRTSNGIYHANYTHSFISYYKSAYLPCTPNWVGKNTSCTSNETLTHYYDQSSDYHSCNITTLPDNVTIGCDYNNDKIIGFWEDFNTKTSSSLHETTLIFVNNTSNLSSQDFTNKIEPVEVKAGNKTFIEFNWNFSSPLDLRNLYIERQESGTKGYLIVKNLHIGKTIYVDILSNSTQICTKNEEISSIGSINTRCNRNNETLLDCPETSNGISCSIVDGRYRITGLTSSGAIEYIDNSTDLVSNCTQNWNYSSWSACTNGSQTRTATDLNHCGSISNRGAITQTCGNTNSSCTPSVTCSAWSGCINATQKRTCRDKNNCQPDKEESKACETTLLDIPNYIYIGLIAVLVIAIIIVAIILIIEFFSHGKKETSYFTS